MAESESGKIELPNEKEIAKLPRLARVAFAARCARRVQPLFKHFWPDAPEEHSNAVDNAIGLAQSLAASPDSANESDLRSDTATYARAAFDADAARGGAAFEAAAAAASAFEAAYARAAARDVARAARAARDAARAARDASTAALASMRRDYELLKAAAEREQWMDETPVPSEFFGPIWPDGVPEGWPVEPPSPTYHGKPMFAENETALRLHFAIPAEMDRDEADRIIQAIILAANELHLAYGGSGLTIADRIRVYEPALVPAGGDE